ncbi:30S ribosomal protein S8 [Candidatus Pacearchaeota archaeon]|nr:30S ribosomal protein S8 [Candidatus Pacearchaeota archaeon]
MSQDITADALNQIMNAKRAGKKELILQRHSKLLISVLAIAKLRGYVKSYKADGTKLHVEIGRLNGCKAIKPRFMVIVSEIEKYRIRYLPAKNIGVIIISTSQGLMTHQTAEEKNIGGSLIAYMY